VPHELGTVSLAGLAGLAGVSGPTGAAGPARCDRTCPVQSL
jgi:hypothetical protein